MGVVFEMKMLGGNSKADGTAAAQPAGKPAAKPARSAASFEPF